jgi:hypothetical protein
MAGGTHADPTPYFVSARDAARAAADAMALGVLSELKVKSGKWVSVPYHGSQCEKADKRI